MYHELHLILLARRVRVVEANVVDERLLGAVLLLTDATLLLPVHVRLLVLNQVCLVTWRKSERF